MSLNRVSIMGRLTKSPELRRTNNGTPVTSFSIAVDRNFGEKKADFFDVVAWKGTAEFVNKYFTKGQMAVIDGRLETRDWEDNNGNKRKNVEIIADNIFFGDSKRDGVQKGVDVSVYDDIPMPTDGFEALPETDSDLPF